MKMAYDAKILYKMKEGHPDWNCEGSPRNEDEVLDFSDTYYFDDALYDPEYDADYIDSSIRHDLKLAAGGGYDSKHIEVVEFKIKRVA